MTIPPGAGAAACCRPGPVPRRAPQEPAAVIVTVWHNVALDSHGRHDALLNGYRPGDPVVAVFTYQADPAGRTAGQIAEEAFAAFNGHPADSTGADLARCYYQRRLRSLSVGDVVAVTVDGEVRLAVAKIGWTPVPGPLTEVRTSEHGTHPLPSGSRPGTARQHAGPGPDQGANS